VDLAAVLDCAVVGISHFSKGSGGRDPTERVVGSVAFGAVARVVLVAAKVKSDDDGKERRILARSKSNIGPDSGGFEYDIDQVELDAHPGVAASRITWGSAVEGTARELLAEPETDGNARENGNAKDMAEQFLRDVLGRVNTTGADYARCETLRAWKSRQPNLRRSKTACPSSAAMSA
jgi:putative DNA primase/helicase